MQASSSGTAGVVGTAMDSPVAAVVGAVVLSVLVWKTKLHLARHRTVGSYAREIRRLSERQTVAHADERRQFQDELLGLADELETYLTETPVKSEYVVTEATALVDTCRRVGNTWVVNEVLGDVQPETPHVLLAAEGQFEGRVADVVAAAEAVERSVLVSLALSPLVNTYDLLRKYVGMLRALVRER